MKKLIKKVFVAALAAIMIFASVPMALVAYANEVEQEPFYLPLRMIFEANGATVSWDGENARIVIDHAGDTIEFFETSRRAYLNDEAFELNFPVAIVDGRAQISYFDASFLFVEQPGVFETTIMTAVVSAFQSMQELSVPGVSIALVDAESGFTWTASLGFADTRNNVFVSEHTVFPVASIAKTFTAIAVMQLVEDGVIGLDTPIVEYLPGFSVLPSPIMGGNYRNITPRMLLTHTSGIIPNFLGYGGSTRGGHSAEFLNSFLDTLANYFLNTPEGTAFTYNNNGYNVLGILVAAMTGENNYFDDYISYMSENILAPAGMSRTAFVIDDSLMPYLARPYINAKTPGELMFFNSIPTGGLISTSYDMARFMHILLNDDGKLLAPGTIGRMMQPHDFDFSLSFGGIEYGLGFAHMTGVDGFRTVGHNGALIHYHSNMVFDTNSSIGVFVAVNSVSGMAMATPLASAILQTAVQEKTGTLNLIPPRADAAAVPVERSAEELSALVGLYIGAGEYYLMELNENGILYMIIPAVPDLPPLPLTPLSDGSFSSMIGRLWFDRVGEGDEEAIVLRLGDLGTMMIAVRTDKEFFLANEKFEPWIGTFAAQPTAGEMSIIDSLRYGVDSFGIAYLQMMQMGIAPATPQSTWQDAWLLGVEDISFDANGKVQSFMLVGMRFVRQ